MNPQRTAEDYFALHVKFSLFSLAGLSTSYRGLGRPKNCRERSFKQMHCGVDQRGSDLHAFRHLPPLENFETFCAEREREREREKKKKKRTAGGQEKMKFSLSFLTKFGHSFRRKSNFPSPGQPFQLRRSKDALSSLLFFISLLAADFNLPTCFVNLPNRPPIVKPACTATHHVLIVWDRKREKERERDGGRERGLLLVA